MMLWLHSLVSKRVSAPVVGAHVCTVHAVPVCVRACVRTCVCVGGGGECACARVWTDGQSR